MTPLDEILRSIAAARRDRSMVLVGIGGHGASGKSTLAARIASTLDDVEVVATDSFWDGSGFDLHRLRTDVVDPLIAGRSAGFDEWDWHARLARPGRSLHPEGVVIVEGVCALHQMFRDDLAVRIWIEAPAEVRLARGVARDGEDARTTWVQVWMPNEDAYVERDDPVGCAHLVVDGTRPFG